MRAKKYFSAIDIVVFMINKIEKFLGLKEA